ncbi:MAG: winged helix-turn-helix transcriptional regulator [Candidatus Bathyarchaeia archaeon]
MGYVYLIPSMETYSNKFRQLDALDFKIIKAMCKEGFSNLSRIAELIDAPQQTVSYHSKKLERQNLVRFRALVNEPKLGLKSFVVVASIPRDKEDIASRAMTCFPLWRYLAIIDGWRHGGYVRYAVPADKERDLEMFLRVVKEKNLISDFEVFATTDPNYPVLNLDLYSKEKGSLVFDWNKWVSAFDSFPEESLAEPANYEMEEIDIYDLIILRCLEINARVSQRKIVKEMARLLNKKEHTKFIPLVSRRIRAIMAEKLVRGYRAYLFPTPIPSTLLLMYRLVFSNSTSLRKFATALGYLPYNSGYEKVLTRNELFVRLILPAYEFSGIWKSMTRLAETGHLMQANLMMGDLASKTWDNVEIYQMFKGKTWNFSYGIAAEMLDRTLAKK